MGSRFRVKGKSESGTLNPEPITEKA